jgi:hypothetical protein
MENYPVTTATVKGLTIYCVCVCVCVCVFVCMCTPMYVCIYSLCTYICMCSYVLCPETHAEDSGGCLLG